MKRQLFAIALAGLIAAPTFSLAEEKKDDGHKHHDHKKDGKDHKHDDHGDDAKSVDIKVADLPAKVAEAFKRDYPTAQIVKAEKETYKDGLIHYEIEYKDKDGKEHDVEYDADGEKLDDH